MQEELFDKKIKSALENIEPEFDPATWDSLARKMDALQNPVPVDEVDKAVFRGLKNLEPAYQPAHWQMLENQLRTAAELRRRVYGSKLAEAAMFLLLIWNLATVLPSLEKRETAPPAKPKYNGPVAEKQDGRKAKRLDLQSQNQTVSLGENFPASPAASLWQPMGGTIFENGQAVLPFENAAHFAVLENLPDGFRQIPSPEDLLKSEGVTSSHPLTQADTQAEPAIASFASLPMLAFQNLDNQRDVPTFKGVTLKSKKEKHFYVSNYASIARAKVKTPYDQDFKKEGYEQRSIGYGGGIAVGMRKGKWGIETGATYASLTYQPRTTIEVYAGNAASGFLGSALRKVDLDVVAVPLKVSRQIASTGKTTLRASAGATANFVAQSGYHYEQIRLPSAQPEPGKPPIPAHGEPLLQKTGRGIFEGGSLTENTWTALDFSARLERPVAQGITAFFEPVLSAVLAGSVGPKNDKIAGLALNAGVVARL